MTDAPDNPAASLADETAPRLNILTSGDRAYVQAILPDFMVEKIAAAVCDMLAARKAKP